MQPLVLTRCEAVGCLAAHSWNRSSCLPSSYLLSSSPRKRGISRRVPASDGRGLFLRTCSTQAFGGARRSGACCKQTGPSLLAFCVSPSVAPARTGKLQALLEKLRNDQQDMERSASDLQNLKDRNQKESVTAVKAFKASHSSPKVKFKAAMLTAHRTGELHKVAGDLAQEAWARRGPGWGTH